MTAKRQATLPVDLCREMGVRPGDKLLLDRKVIGGETVWVIRTGQPDWSWFGAARTHAQGRSHRWSDIERSIERAWRHGGRSDRP